MRAELFAVGDELLYGDILNGNAAQLGRQLADVGVTVSHSVVVGDDIETIAEALRAALARADAVLLTGGLGPTQDDLTREGLARAAGVELHARRLPRRPAAPPLSRPAPQRARHELPAGGPSRRRRAAAQRARHRARGPARAARRESRTPCRRAARDAGDVHRLGAARSAASRRASRRSSFTGCCTPRECGSRRSPRRWRRRSTGWRREAAGQDRNPTIAFLASGGQTRVRISRPRRQPG